MATTIAGKNSVHHNHKVRENIAQLSRYICSSEPLRRKSILKGCVGDAALSQWLMLTLCDAAAVLVTGESSGYAGKHSHSDRRRSSAPNTKSVSMIS
jgi:hypothetical protein